MYKYHLKIEYDGSNFVGWQYQKNGLSIQEALEKILSKFLREKINIIGSGRTDAGVHAIEQSAHIETKNKIEKKKFLAAINHYLFKQPISLLDIKEKDKKFHARFSAKKRTYKYLIVNRISPLALNPNRAWHVKKKLDYKLMKKSLKLLKGTHDFSTFRASSCEAKSPVRTIKDVKLNKKKDTIEIIFISKSFLQTQVRSMVGAIKYVGEKRWPLSLFKKKFKSKKRSNCAPPAPAHGLYLQKVEYK